MKNPTIVTVLLAVVVVILLAMTSFNASLASGYEPTLTFVFDPTETPKMPPTVDILPTVGPYLPYEPPPVAYPEPSASVPSFNFYTWLTKLIKELENLGYSISVNMPTFRE